MRSPHAALLALVLTLAAGGALEAQNIPSPFRYVETRQSLGAFAGYFWTNPAIEPDSITGEIELGPRSAPLFGVRYGYRLGDPASVEVALGFAPSERRVYRNGGVAGDTAQLRIVDTGETASAPLVLAEARLHLNLTGARTWNNLAPFVGVTGGLIAEVGGADGAEEDIPEDERFDFGPGFAVGAEIGTDWFLSERVSVRAELRDVLWRVEVPVGLRRDEREDEGRWTQNFGVALGGAIHF